MQERKATSQDGVFLVCFITTLLLQQITDKYSQTDNQGLSNKSSWYFTVSLYLFLSPLSPSPSSLSRECLTPKLLFCFLQGPTAFFLKLLYDYLKRDLKIKKDRNNGWDGADCFGRRICYKHSGNKGLIRILNSS